MKKSDKKKRSLLGALPAVPYVVWMVLFIAIPLGMVAFFALTDPQGQFTLENIARGGEHMSVPVHHHRLPAGIHPFPQAGLPEADVVCHGHAADVDELFAAHLCMDDHSGK